MVAVRWYLRYCLSYRDVEELLVERGVEVDHVTIFRTFAARTTNSPSTQPATERVATAFAELARAI